MGNTRDYYADLEISPNADTAEIKKQYRKLALKYHPDRNPGREEEVNSQFLTIQAAHDVLIDTQERAKYDSSRKSGAGRFPTASGVRGNPWSNVSQQYPTPPRRQNPTSRNPTSGADRWNQRFSTGVPPTARTSAAAGSGAETKKNAASAFEKMRNKSQSGAKSQPPPTPPRAEYAKQRAEASFGASRSSRASRASAYVPSASGSGDEPSVSNSNYSTHRDPPASHSRPAPEQKPQHIPMSDPLRQFREDSFVDLRKSSPYTTHGGEKTNPFDGTNLGRSKSTREPPRNTNQGTDEVPFSSRRPRSTTESGGPSMASSDMKTESSEHFQHHGHAQSDAQTPRTPFTEANAGPTKKPSIFIISDSDEGHEQKGFARSSVDDINTSFVNEPAQEKWEFSAGGNDQGRANQPQSQQSQNSSQPAPVQSPEPQVDHANGSARDQAFGDHRFHAEGWGGQFGPETFVPPVRNGSTGSPSKTARTNTKKAKASKSPNGDNAIVINDSSDDDTFTWRGRKSQPSETVADSPQAMDIDSPRAELSASPPPVSSEPRNIPVEPSRPEWRSGDRVGADNIPTTPSPSIPKDYSNAVGSEDSEEFKATLADLRSASPLQHEKSGLKSFGEMKDNLPFESRAAGEVPLNEVLSPQPLAFPQAPQAPRLPPTVAVSGLQPNVASWEKYASEFEGYMREWDSFQRKVTDHFATRMSHITGSRESKGYGFLRRNEEHCLEYFKSIQQDNDVRRRWNTECEEHERRLREFIAFREKMK